MIQVTEETAVKLINGFEHRNLPLCLIKGIGLQETLFLIELLSKWNYFKINNKLDKDGYFFRTQNSIEKAIEIPKYKQTKILKTLKKLNLINTKLKGSPGKLYYKINSINIINIMEKYENEQSMSQEQGSYMSQDLIQNTYKDQEPTNSGYILVNNISLKDKNISKEIFNNDKSLELDNSSKTSIESKKQTSSTKQNREKPPLAGSVAYRPLCQGLGILSPDQKQHWQDFSEHHGITECGTCGSVHLVCDAG